MTPAARLQSAIEVLDQVLAGVPAEKALTVWARSSRFAGSGDRAAVRDHVFTALRCRRSHAALGGAETGRGLILGALRESGEDPAKLFSGDRFAPAPLTEAERSHLARPAAPDRLVALDCPDWLAPQLEDSLGEDFVPVMQALRARAPVFLRVNLARLSRAEARARLAAEGIATQPADLANSALEVTDNARKIQGSPCYLDGSVELQDVASQAVIQALPLTAGDRVLDYCAGGGGKTLAMAARARLSLFAHDADAGRMRDLGPRADRAGVRVTQVSQAQAATAAPYDLVLLDVPCSGSGSWRRAPDAKWRLTPEKLHDLCAIQADILEKTKSYVKDKGHLVYVTCSLLEAENGARVRAFLKENSGWRLQHERRLTPVDGGDGFYLAILTRTTGPR